MFSRFTSNWVIAVGVLTGTISLPVSAAMSTALAPIVGTFNCVTHESAGTIWRFKSVNQPWGAWVRADTTFAPQNGQAADTASTYVGFDAASKQWNIVSIDTNGSYYSRYSRSRAFDGSHWTDGYPDDGAKAAITVRGTSGYTFDLRAPAKNGRTDSSRTVCTRA